MIRAARALLGGGLGFCWWLIAGLPFEFKMRGAVLALALALLMLPLDPGTGFPAEAQLAGAALLGMLVIAWRRDQETWGAVRSVCRS